jgi:hypothetical protein
VLLGEFANSVLQSRAKLSVLDMWFSHVRARKQPPIDFDLSDLDYRGNCVLE